MSVQALSWAMEQRGLDDGEARLLWVLANRANEEGVAYPGQLTLAEWCEASERTIRRRLASLQERGLLTREHRQRENGSRTSDEIHLALESNRTPASGRTESNRTPVSGPETKGVRSTALTGEQSTLVDVPSPRKNVSVAHHKLTGDEWKTASALLSRFNERAGTKFGALTSRRDPSPNAVMIIRRIREWPEMTADDHLAVLDRCFDKPWWKGKIRTVGIVYAPGQYPKAVNPPDEARQFEAERDDSEIAYPDGF